MEILGILWIVYYQIFNIGIVHSQPPLRPQKDIQKSEALDYLLRTTDYRKAFPPEFNYDRPTEITCQIMIDSIDSINEATMDFTLSMFLYQRWCEHRLMFRGIVNTTYLELDANAIKEIWVPDLYFPNEKRSNFHEVTMANRMLRINEEGNTLFSMRITMTLTCKMNLRNFPFDKQVCSMQVASFSYTNSTLLLRWFPVKAVQISKDVVDTQFIMQKVTQSECVNFVRQEGNHSCLQANFHLTRSVGYYVVQMYIPTILIVVLSWLSFWLNVDSVPGRISLGVLTVLTTTTQISSVNATLPRVSYTKAIDIWMATCLLFVFAALLEFAVANILSRKETMNGFFFQHVYSRDGKQTHTNYKSETKSDPTSSINKDCDVEGGIRKRTGIWYACILDSSSRIAFPLMFALFNLIYWPTYLGKTD
ncbi:glycine receptor subunit alpha-1-like isoform X3 [Octopus vulgaris]|uniref:Glycine receptor subunit alpha-1-like isoform X3 n=2 Tax=Octopus TaxID=6643 RepID=A0AA36F5H9_OCTVU|nr:glycine receptor subunit alpha-1-like isoform X3 [Octopus vulgaris]